MNTLSGDCKSIDTAIFKITEIFVTISINNHDPHIQLFKVVDLNYWFCICTPCKKLQINLLRFFNKLSKVYLHGTKLVLTSLIQHLKIFVYRHNCL